jgi:hypothetical protein
MLSVDSFVPSRAAVHAVLTAPGNRLALRPGQETPSHPREWHKPKSRIACPLPSQHPAHPAPAFVCRAGSTGLLPELPPHHGADCPVHHLDLSVVRAGRSIVCNATGLLACAHAPMCSCMCQRRGCHLQVMPPCFFNSRCVWALNKNRSEPCITFLHFLFH